MYADFQKQNNRNDVEASILAAALKQSYERGDGEGLKLAHKQLSIVIRKRADGAEQALEAGVPDATLTPETAGTGTGAYTEAGPLEALLPGPEENQADFEPAEIKPPEEAASQEGPGTGQAGAPTGKPETVVRTAYAEPPPAQSTVTEGEAPADTSAEKAGGDYYQLLDINYMAEFAQIHVAFLRKIRKLLAETGNHEDPWAFRDKLREFCIAHDVLKDPITRTDYDFRQMGIRKSKPDTDVELQEETISPGFSNTPRLKIGELLQCAGILNSKELEIAVDMHKAMPESLFGQFLVKQEFLTQEVLESALIGQNLILAGKITVGQYQVAMYSLKDADIPLADTLLVRGWVDEQDLEEATRIAREPPSRKEVEEPANRPARTDAVQPAGEVVEQQQAPIAADSAMPSWADQIDWDGPEDEPKLLVDQDKKTEENTD